MILATSGSLQGGVRARDSLRRAVHYATASDEPDGLMLNLVKAPIRAGRHLAIWIVWQSTGVTLIPTQRP
jgi:hypothetical protein